MFNVAHSWLNVDFTGKSGVLNICGTVLQNSLPSYHVHYTHRFGVTVGEIPSTECFEHQNPLNSVSALVVMGSQHASHQFPMTKRGKG